jgi:hypothetical protein
LEAVIGGGLYNIRKNWRNSGITKDYWQFGNNPNNPPHIREGYNGVLGGAFSVDPTVIFENMDRLDQELGTIPAQNAIPQLNSAKDVPHWLAPYVPPIDWASPLPRGANSYDIGRSVPGSSAGGWLGLQQSDFGVFGKLPQGNLGKRSDLAPDSRDRSNTSVTNPLISMGLLPSSLDGNQAPFPTQAATAPAQWSPQPPSTESDALHWLEPYVAPMDRASPPPPPVSDVPPWFDPGSLDKGLWRLGFPE